MKPKPGKTDKFLWWRIRPITARRLANFRAHRRGYWSFWLFAGLFIFTLFAEFIANDRPLLVWYDGGLYAPVLKDYREWTFDGSLPGDTDYSDEVIRRNIRFGPQYRVFVPGLRRITPAAIFENAGLGDVTSTGAYRLGRPGWALWPLIPYSYNASVKNLDRPAPTPPSAQNWLGTDNQARDVVARVIYGFRISVLFGLVLTILSSVIGVIAGAIQGYFGGRVDLYFQRFMEIWDSVPTLYLLIILSAFIQPDFWWLLGIMLLFSWMGLVGLVRAEFLRARNFDYVRAARAMGASSPAIMFRHILPNALVATISFMPFITSGSIGALTALDFLGFGLPPGSASLGELAKQGKEFATIAPWLGLTAFFIVAIMLSLLVFIGEAVRDAFDPRKMAVSGVAAEPQPVLPPATTSQASGTVV